MIRVELHGASRAQYSPLHSLLALHGITDVIVADTGVRYRLPPGEYCYNGNATKQQVLTSAKQCAAQIVPAFAVVVTESNGVMWEGLQAA